MSATQNLIEEARAAASGLSKLLDRLSDAFASEESIRNCPNRQSLTSALHASFKACPLAEALDEIEAAIEPWALRGEAPTSRPGHAENPALADVEVHFPAFVVADERGKPVRSHKQLALVGNAEIKS